ncbi:MAG: hypothetical protein AAB581_00255 [Patescibacteria group bacterium]
MNKKFVIPAFLLCTLLIAGVLSFYAVQNSAKKPTARNLLSSQMDALSDQEKYTYQEQIAALIKTSDFSKCDAIADPLYKTVCVNNIALGLAKGSGDISFCQKIDNKLLPIEECERQVILEQSMAREDATICKQTKNQKLQEDCENSFYMQLAVKKNDVSLCDKTREDQQEYCQNNFYVVTKDFMGNSTSFDCSVLEGKDEKSDCEKLKSFDGKKGNIQCFSEIKSSLFLSYCQTWYER